MNQLTIRDKKGKVAARFPMSNFERLMLEGVVDEMDQYIGMAKAQLANPEIKNFKEGVDPISIIVDSAERKGKTSMLLELDDIAKGHKMVGE